MCTILPVGKSYLPQQVRKNVYYRFDDKILINIELVKWDTFLFYRINNNNNNNTIRNRHISNTFL